MFSDELNRVIDLLDKTDDRGKKIEIELLFKRLVNAAAKIGKAWSGSPIGYHANVYYDGLNIPPQGTFFDSEHGFMDTLSNRTWGDWKEFDPDYVRQIIYEHADNPDMNMLRKFTNDVTMIFENCKMDVLSIFYTEINKREDVFLSDLTRKVDGLSIISRIDAEKAFLPHGEFVSREPGIFNQTRQLPPHLRVLSEASAIKNVLDSVLKLRDIAKQARAHLFRQQNIGKDIIGTRIFIGHGRSPIWREIREFVTDRLNLPVDEFNRVPVAGLTNIDRLNQMLETASIAFLIMTGEDEQSDGKLQARMNVVHEAGLFQGRLGFRRAIIVLEDGCEEFSNIEGLGQIRFAKGNVKEAFEEIRMVLEREGLLRAIS